MNAKLTNLHNLGSDHTCDGPTPPRLLRAEPCSGRDLGRAYARFHRAAMGNQTKDATEFAVSVSHSRGGEQLRLRSKVRLGQTGQPENHVMHDPREHALVGNTDS